MAAMTVPVKAAKLVSAWAVLSLHLMVELLADYSVTTMAA
jgi:hypothetical protein